MKNRFARLLVILGLSFLVAQTALPMASGVFAENGPYCCG